MMKTKLMRVLFLLAIAVGCAKKAAQADDGSAAKPQSDLAGGAPAGGAGGGAAGDAGPGGSGPGASPAPEPETWSVAAENDCVADDCARRALEFTDSDRDQALSLFLRGCDTGGSVACSMLAIAYEQGRGVTPDLARAAELYGLGCDRGYAKACNNLGLMYAEGRGVGIDLDRAVHLLDDACAGGAFRGCGSLGDLLVNQGEVERARPILDRGCAGGDEPSCATLARLAADAQ